MNPLVKRFIIELLFGVCFAFLLHILVLYLATFPLFENSIVLSYTVNVLLAVIIFTTLYLLKEKYKNQIGFLFLGGSFLKFLVFFILFYPIFKQDGDITNLEFASFFVPYAICLLIETLGVIRILKD